MRHRTPRRRERIGRWMVLVLVAGVLFAINGPAVISFASSEIHNIEINQQSYKEAKGHWSILDVPSKFQINSVHAALLYTGKVLIVAGSGNNAEAFRAGTFKSIVWNPANNKFKLIHTPSDMFCGGHAFLPDGKLLIAGGTSRYEILASRIVRAAGVMLVVNQAANGKTVKLPAGSEFMAPNGHAYRSVEEVTVPPAKKQPAGWIKPGEGEIWVEAVEKGKSAAVDSVTRFSIAGVSGVQAKDLYGVANSLTMNEENFWASNKSYLFNPATESYERVSDLSLARWYPTLVGLKDGKVLAVSGLGRFGQIIPGKNEIYDPATRRWAIAAKLQTHLPHLPGSLPAPVGQPVLLRRQRGLRLGNQISHAGDLEPDQQHIPGRAGDP